MNTGEGGYPKYHLMGGADLIFQMGTAKFGVRDEKGLLDEDRQCFESDSLMSLGRVKAWGAVVDEFSR